MRTNLDDKMLETDLDSSGGETMVSGIDLEKFLAEIDSASDEQSDFWVEETEPPEIIEEDLEQLFKEARKIKPKKGLSIEEMEELNEKAFR